MYCVAAATRPRGHGAGPAGGAGVEAARWSRRRDLGRRPAGRPHRGRRPLLQPAGSSSAADGGPSGLPLARRVRARKKSRRPAVRSQTSSACRPRSPTAGSTRPTDTARRRYPCAASQNRCGRSTSGADLEWAVKRAPTAAPALARGPSAPHTPFVTDPSARRRLVVSTTTSTRPSTPARPSRRRCTPTDRGRRTPYRKLGATSCAWRSFPGGKTRRRVGA